MFITFLHRANILPGKITFFAGSGTAKDNGIDS